MERATRFELATLSLGNAPTQRAGLTPASSSSQVVENIQSRNRRNVQPSQGLTRFSQFHVANMYQKSSRQFAVIEGGVGRLLSVRDVAEILNVHRATVYKICERGELRHMRVSNAVRVSPRDLAAYIRAQRVVTS